MIVEDLLVDKKQIPYYAQGKDFARALFKSRT